MTFAAPLFLLAALAGLIPVALHMINRQKAKDLPFSTLRFLRISVQKTRRRKRIHDVLLMLMRVALLLLLALGLAKPTVTSLGSLLGVGARSAVAIVVDNSASMGMIDQDRVRLETATNAAGQILDEWQGGDEVVLLPTNGPPLADEDRLERTPEKARQMLPQCRVSYERADLAAKLHQARKLLANSTATNKQIYVISDGQAVSWDGMKAEGEHHLAPGEHTGGRGRDAEGPRQTAEEPTGVQESSPKDANLEDAGVNGPHPKGEGTGGDSALPEGERTGGDNPVPEGEERESLRIPVVVIDCNRTPKPNVAVQSVVLDVEVPVAGIQMKASVGLLNTSTVPQSATVELYLDGTKEAASPALSIPAEGRVVHDFLFTFKHGGLHRGEVRLTGADGSKYDDQRFFTIEVDQEVAVAVVKAQRHEIPCLEEAFYLEQALSPGHAEGWALQTTPLVAADLLSEPLDKYKVIFCVNLPALPVEAAERLKSYVAGGGNLVWICGDGVNPEAYNQMNEQAGEGLLPAPLLEVRTPGTHAERDSWHIGFLEKKHPALAHLVEPAGLYESVLVYRHVRIDAARAPEAQVLARLDDGEPLLVQRAVGPGKVLLLGSGAHLGWSNLPLRPIFLPLVARLCFFLAGTENARHDLVAGAPLVLHLEHENHPIGVEVLPPTGETLRLTSKEEPGEKGQVFRYRDTHPIGVYLLRPLEATRAGQIAYSVNFDPDEADPVKIDRGQLQSRFGRTPLVFAEDPDDLSSTFKMLREGKSLWGPFLLAVLVVLVFETLLSNRLSPTPDKMRAVQPSPGMRRLAKIGRTP